MELAPDLLDRFGLPIREVGSMQLAIERARLHWPSGEARVWVLLQAAWSGENEVALEVSGESGSVRRSVRVPHGEVRRVRLPLSLVGGAEPLVLRVHAPIREGASRVRAAWLPGATAQAEAQASTFGTLVGAIKQAVGMREKRPALQAEPRAELPLQLEAFAGEAPIAAEEEAVWQPGMPEPLAFGLRVADGAPAATQASRADGSGDRPECPRCFTRAYAEQVRAERRCPSCGNAWAL